MGENDKDRLQKATNARIQQLLLVGHRLDLVNYYECEVIKPY